MFNGGFSSGVVEAPERSTNPFTKELAQLDEVAEEFGHVVRDAESDADVVFMETHGLAAFSCSDYLSEIHGLMYSQFNDERNNAVDFGGWI